MNPYGFCVEFVKVCVFFIRALLCVRYLVFGVVPYCYREEELQLKKRKQRKIKGNSRLSFADDIENGSEEEDVENGKYVFVDFETRRCQLVEL